jgi:serine/threonine protein kinase
MIAIEDRARAVFLAALEREPDQWPAYLDEACAENAELRARVNELLDAHQAMGTIHSGRANGTAIYQPQIAEGPGTVIGSYKLLQQIGEGGMGVVFMAEQTEPIQRTVALKIIKPGMDTRQVIARFEAERQALAMMDHPNIAKVLNAGTTDTGRPYFVMELVKGVPITRYCDDKQLSLRQRLDLIKPVCEAVQHAHQKGIIHRDLKPTNVLVAEYDNRAIPKVIDFGVAKATAQKLTERTMFTELGQVIGTVEYMSPEQAKFNQLDIDTRSDIYSLGVLLYELLTGSTPFERERLREAAFDEVLRIIREEDPPKPSTRLSMSEPLPSIAANRHSEPARLSKDVSGELDWIVMKCLEKDRNRRYETANGLIQDIERYLSDEAVQACPPSAAYRCRKFVRRNKVAILTTSVISLALLVAVGATVWSLVDRSVRRAKTNYGIGIALNDAANAREQMLTHMDNPFKWDASLAAALSAIKEAEQLAAQEPGKLETATAGELDELKATLRSDQEDRRFVARLDEILRDVLVWNANRNRTKHAETLQELRNLFQSRSGWEIGTTPVDQVATFFKQRPKPVQQHILVALDVALALAPKDKPECRKWLGDVLQAIDPDSWRRQAREALAAEDWQTLERLLQDVNVAQQSPALLYTLSSYLPSQTMIGTRSDLYQRIRSVYPGELWVYGRYNTALSYHVLAWQLLVPSALKYDNEVWATNLAESATRLVPNDGDFWHVLAIAYCNSGNASAATSAAQKAIDLSGGGEASDWFVLAVIENFKGNKDAAREWYDKAVAQMEKNPSPSAEMRYYRDETAKLLGITKTPNPQPATSNTQPSIPNPKP